MNLRVTEIGSGEPLVIVPGNTGDVFPLIPLLAELKVGVSSPSTAGGGASDGMDHRGVDFGSWPWTPLPRCWMPLVGERAHRGAFDRRALEPVDALDPRSACARCPAGRARN